MTRPDDLWFTIPGGGRGSRMVVLERYEVAGDSRGLRRVAHVVDVERLNRAASLSAALAVICGDMLRQMQREAARRVNDRERQLIRWIADRMPGAPATTEIGSDADERACVLAERGFLAMVDEDLDFRTWRVTVLGYDAIR
jgi:ubiquinone biosynthesis protein UbiJ